MVDVVPGAARVEFSAGFYRASGTCWLDDVTCAPMPREVRINAHYGKPEDGLVIEPDQLMMFSPDQRYEGDAGSGYEATAQLGGVARWYPLELMYRDESRLEGPIAKSAIVHHFEGIFAGSTWALFGADRVDLFGGSNRYLREGIERLKRGVFFRSVETEYPSYRDRETVNIAVRLSNASRMPRQETLACNILVREHPENKEIHFGPTNIELAPGNEFLQEYKWTIPEGNIWGASVEVRMGEGKDIRSLITNSFSTSIYVLHKFGDLYTQLRSEKNAYFIRPLTDCCSEKRIIGLPGTCLFGTDTYSNMFFSPSAMIAAWDSVHGDLELMQESGIDVIENLQFVPENYGYSGKQWRQFDALIQGTQGRMLVYMAGLLVGQDVAVSDEELEKQAEMCAAFARRYKDVPALIYYLNGDFQLKLKDLPDLRREWNRVLRERYGSHLMRDRWYEIAPEDGGDLPVTDHAAQSWYDPKARDVAEFKMRLMRRWIDRLCESLHSEDNAEESRLPGALFPTRPGTEPKYHPITAEYYQRTYNGIDLRLTMEAMDAANFGYFDAPKRDLAKLMATIKWNDMRLVDKMVNIGEFGVKTHDAWTPEHGASAYHIRRTPEEYDQLVWWMVHAALAMGVSKIQNWCWADDPDRIFPWGLCYNNPLRAKPALELYSALRKAAGFVRIDYTPAETVFVMPDSWRVGAPEDFAHNTLINAHELLLAVNTPYDTANEAHLDRLLQKPPKWVVMPMAYAMSDATLDKLRALADAGSLVYLSGDPSIGPDGTRIPERLERLCGVKFESEIAHPAGTPVPLVSTVDAKEVENPCGLKLYRRDIGKGAILWTPEPWETLKGKDVFVDDPGITADPKQNLYLWLAPMAGIAPAAKLTADSGVWRVMVTPTAGKRLITVFPRTEVTAPTAVNVKGEGFDLNFVFTKTWPAMVLLDENNQFVMGTGTGPLTLNAQPVMNGAGAWIYVPRDKIGEKFLFTR